MAYARLHRCHRRHSRAAGVRNDRSRHSRHRVGRSADHDAVCRCSLVPHAYAARLNHVSTNSSRCPRTSSSLAARGSPQLGFISSPIWTARSARDAPRPGGADMTSQVHQSESPKPRPRRASISCLAPGGCRRPTDPQSVGLAAPSGAYADRWPVMLGLL